MLRRAHQKAENQRVFLTILGWVGAIVVLAGYALFSLNKLPNGPLYQLSNLVGACCISLNVAAHGAWPSTVVNGVWAIIALVVLLRMVRGRARAKRLVAVDRVDEEHERRMQDAERAQLAPGLPGDTIPVVTAALAVVALAVVHQGAEQADAASSSGVPQPRDSVEGESLFASGTAVAV